ncbi:MAG TPA: peptide deformylase [Holosporales bacterium]|nr:peptide deformylase [Holosporales bacterium]
MTDLPSYVVINNDDQSQELRSVLRTPAQKIAFPLSPEDQESLKILEAKYDVEENCAGLAAPQIGTPKQMIVFEAICSPELKKWRPDFTQEMPKTIWVNPSYEGIGEELHEDYEGCFSVNDLAGPVKRFIKIAYKATLPDGTSVAGEAEGFLARVIQHEVDHIRGTLCIDKVPEGKLMSISAYREMRSQKMAEAKEKQDG